MTAAIEFPRDAALNVAPGPVSPGDAARVRIAFLISQHQALVAQTQFADAKAAALIALAGIFAFTGPFETARMHEGVLGFAPALLIALSALACLWAIIPRYPNMRRQHAQTSFGFAWTDLAAVNRAPDSYADFALHGDLTELMSALARSNVTAARVLAKKFAAMRTAILFTIAAILLTAIRIALAESGVVGI